MALGSSLPQISISLAPSEEQPVEPYSPFDSSFTSAKDAPDAYRASHLTPPPTASNFPKQLSPLRPVESVTEGTGMQRERFEILLKASRARQAAIPVKKDTGLLREIALKAHKNKQVERRALFLSKVLAPPSPTATFTPKTPPESPAIFHYSLPSPGLSSPLSLFESLDELDDGTAKDCWVEQVDFRPLKPIVPKAPVIQVTQSSKTSRPLPSLDQISAHIHGRAANSTTSSRLPAFLKAPRRLPSPPAGGPRLVKGVGRLTLPVRAPEPVKTVEAMLPPATPTSPLTPKLQVTTVLVPRTTATSSIQLTEINLQSLNSREQRSKNMLSAIRKRHSGVSDLGRTSQVENVQRSQMLAKRKSAPSDLASARMAVWGSGPVSGGF